MGTKSQNSQSVSPQTRRLEEERTMNKSLFEEKWNLLRGRVNAKWSLMVE
ncbi:MAG: hypothetical protein IPP55_02735 [Anaerolineales bacterium]|nr:hypothetical protein [Anaerolineales bacterium]